MSRASSRRRVRPAVIAWLALGALCAALVAIVAAVGVGAFVAQKELRAAVPVVSEMQEQFASDDRGALDDSIAELQMHAGAARGAADTWLWWIAEQAPFIGPSLHAVRESTVAVDELAKGVLPELVDIDPALLRPRGGTFNIAGLTELSAPIAAASDAAERASGALEGVNLRQVPGLLREPLSQLTAAVAALQPALSRADAVLPQLPSLMGQDGPKNYLLLVQNNAEARGLGGIPASVVLLRVENGRLDIVQQASSRDFANERETPIVPLDPEVVKLYDDKIGRWSQDVTSTPDFGLSAELAKAYWTERFGTPVDGVLAIDPVVLSYILEATGPITLATGDELTATDAVRILLSDVYARYPDNKDQDIFFASAAVEVFDAISSGDFSPIPFASAVVRSIDENRIYFYPFDDAARATFAGSRLLGPLPSTSEGTDATVGVFVNDLTEAKLSFYTNMSTELVVDRCSAVPTYTAVVTFANGLDEATSNSLVEYVNAGAHYPKGTIGTDLQIYGPIGSHFVNAVVDGADVAITTGEHLDRPVGRLWIVNPPQTVHTLAVKFEGTRADGDDVALVHTPMVNPVSSTVVEAPCK
ncbi:DUF4012 domain-containing protein [Microbacterium testaceum]|uniref:DUF4012 domain-containing protein n=1 Tax=Microbacterium testaceum TaxID=2033 RepID=UPI001D171E86|nr:DUF4012 domain-containing protein [Microbacterium testaceum]MCC4248625.1 DUF4012 domain-containing protein [Microbacterium testaceum]